MKIFYVCVLLILVPFTLLATLNANDPTNERPKETETVTDNETEKERDIDNNAIKIDFMKKFFFIY